MIGKYKSSTLGQLFYHVHNRFAWLCWAFWVILDPKRILYDKVGAFLLNSFSKLQQEVQTRIIQSTEMCQGKYRYYIFRGGNLLCKSHHFQLRSPQPFAQMISMVEHNSNLFIYYIPHWIKKSIFLFYVAISQTMQIYEWP
jgi:hypothetical protein